MPQRPADNFISTYDANGKHIDIPYPFVHGLPVLPSTVVDLQKQGTLTIRCAHGYPCAAVALSDHSPSKRLRGCSFARCPNQENHRCAYFVNLTDIYQPLMVACSAPYPSPPLSSKRPSSETSTPKTPSKRRRIKKEPTPTYSPDEPSFHPPPPYYTPPPFERKGPLVSNASDDDIVLFFTDLKDATIGRHGGLVLDRTNSSTGTFTTTNIDLPVLLFRIRRRLFSGPRDRAQEQEDLRELVKDLPGAAIGSNNEMIGGPSSFLATGSKSDPIDVDNYAAPEPCPACSLALDNVTHLERCYLGTS